MDENQCLLFPTESLVRERTAFRELAHECYDFVEARLVDLLTLTKEELEFSPEKGKTIVFSFKGNQEEGESSAAETKEKLSDMWKGSSKPGEALFNRIIKLEARLAENTKNSLVYEALGSNKFLSMADLFEFVLALLDHFFRAAVKKGILEGRLEDTLSSLPFRSCSLDDVSYTASLQHWCKKRQNKRSPVVLEIMDEADAAFFGETKLQEGEKHWMRKELLCYQQNTKQARNLGAHVFSATLKNVKDEQRVRASRFQYSFDDVPFSKTQMESQKALKLEVLKDIAALCNQGEVHHLFASMVPLLTWVIPWVEGLFK